jgi:capsular polysaccharide biosynthesis protein
VTVPTSGETGSVKTLLIEDDLGRAAPGRLTGLQVTVGLVVGLLVGAILGGVVGLGRPASYQATTVASISPDDSVAEALQATSGTTQDTSDYIQGELVVITSATVRSQVQHQLGLSSLPTVTASQSGTTDVVDITATGSSQAEAIRIADTARSVYADLRRDEVTTDTAAAQLQVAKQTNTVRAEIAVTPGAATNGASALQQEYARLLVISSELALDAAQAPQSVTTIQTATADGGGLSAAETYALAGGVLGVLVAAGALVLLRRARPRVRSLDDLRALTGDAVVPAFSRSAPDAPARVLAGRLLPEGGAESLVLLAADADAGVDELAVSLAQALARSRPVLLIADPDDVDRLLAMLPEGAVAVSPKEVRSSRVMLGRLRELGAESSARRIRVLDTRDERAAAPAAAHDAVLVGWTVLVSAPPLMQSDLGLQVARAVAPGVNVTVVAGRSTARPMDVLSAVDSVVASRLPTLTALLTTPRPRWRRQRATPPAVSNGRSRHARTASTRVVVPAQPDTAPSIQPEPVRATSKPSPKPSTRTASAGRRRPVSPVDAPGRAR